MGEKVEFDAVREGTGTAEWAERTVNIQQGCRNNCLYCYAAESAARFGKRKRDEWSREELTKRAGMLSYPAYYGVVMFPSTHDITPYNFRECIRIMALILNAGNRLLIVSKPRMYCIPAILSALATRRKHILFRFTIGAVDPAICKIWEPGAPEPGERIDCLRAAYIAGFRTSVSIEPMLSGACEVLATVEAVQRYVTDTIWIGKMNKVRSRVVGQDKLVAAIEELQSDKNIMWLYDKLKNDPMIRWKDSIKQVVANQSPAPVVKERP